MAIAQDTYYIPDDYATGIATGLYNRYGSVLRYAIGPKKGQIVKHLQPIELKEAESAKGFVNKALQYVQENQKEAGLVAVGVTVIGLVVWGCIKWRSHEPKVVAKFRVALRTYIEAIRQGNMDIKTIDNLMKALDALKQHKNYKKINIQLTTQELEVLVGRIYEYTVKLAADNAFELSEDELCVNNGVIINLQTYLEAQKKIFQKAA